MNDADDYLGKMPFFIVFLDPLHTDFHSRPPSNNPKRPYPMLLFIDNYDSFTYNIVQYFAELGQEVVVRRNDDITLEEIEALKPQYLVIGPGPCSPKEAGISVAAMRHFAGKLPIMGVCLGHQTIGEAFGGDVVRAKTLMHGKVSPVFHLNKGMFKDLPDPVTCTRYHSLVIARLKTSKRPPLKPNVV